MFHACMIASNKLRVDWNNVCHVKTNCFFVHRIHQQMITTQTSKMDVATQCFVELTCPLAQTQDGDGFVAQGDRTAKTGTSGTSHFASRAAGLFPLTRKCQCQILFLELEEHRVYWRKTVKTGRVQSIEQLIR